MQQAFYMIRFLHLGDYQAEPWQQQNCHCFVLPGCFTGKKVQQDLIMVPHSKKSPGFEHDLATQDMQIK